MKRTSVIFNPARSRDIKAFRGAASTLGAAVLICAAFLSCLLFPAPAHAQASSQGQSQKPIVAVADFAGTGVSSAELAALRASFEIELFRAGSYNVVERTQADAILREQQYQLSGCVDEACMIEVGKHLGAQYVFVGTASKIGSTIQIIIKMVDVKLGSLLKAATVSGRTIDELASALPRAALELSGRSDISGGSGQLAWDSTAGGTGAAGGAASTGGAAGTGTAPAERAYVTFESTPPGMTLVIRDAAGKILGTYQTPKALPLTRGSYIVEAEDPAGMYYPYKENLDFSRPAKATFTITMAPRFGTVSISSDPPGARVSLNGLDIGATPIAGRQLKSGTYEIALSMELYTTKRVTLTVQDGRTAAVSERLAPNFVTIDAREKNGIAAELWIDGKKAADLPYTGKLPFRDFDLSIRSKDGRYRPYEERVIVRAAGETLSRAVALEARTGTLAVETEPTTAADVYLDGKKIGTAPDIFTVLMGDHELRVTATLNGQRMEAVKRVTIAEGRETAAVLALAAPAAAAPAGSGAASQSDYTSPTIGVLRYVPGGTFQRDDTSSNTSTVRPFRMSQYEITRAQFRAWMGTDPSDTSVSSGMDDPVQNVNWYHAIAFCNKLSIAEG